MDNVLNLVICSVFPPDPALDWVGAGLQTTAALIRPHKGEEALRWDLTLTDLRDLRVQPCKYLLQILSDENIGWG